MNVNRLLRSAVKALGLVDGQSTLDPVILVDALESANMMLSTWATAGLIVHHVITEQFPLVAGQEVYTIGTTGNFDTTRPNRLIGGFIRDSNNTDTPIEIISRDRYNSLANKETSGIPRYLYYYPTFPLARIYVYFSPFEAYTLSLDSLKPLTALVLDADLNMPPEYEEAIKWNLAVRLAPDYGRTPRPDVVALANSTYDKLSIQPIPEATCEGAPGMRVYRGAGSIYTL
jgi:hypothetical protein